MNYLKTEEILDAIEDFNYAKRKLENCGINVERSFNQIWVKGGPSNIDFQFDSVNDFKYFTIGWIAGMERFK